MKNFAAAALVLLAAAPQDSITLAGKVLDDRTQKPVAGIEFTLYVQAEAGAGRQHAVTTDENGAFKVSVRKNSGIFVMWNPGRPYLLDEEERYVRLEPLQADRTDLELKVRTRPTVELKARVTDAAGRPVGGASAHFEMQMPALRTGESGEAVFKTAPADKDYELYVVSSNGRQAAVARLKAGATEAQVALKPTLDVPGEAVADDGKPAANLRLAAHMVLNGKPFMEMRRQTQGLATGEDGRFSFKAACEGATYSLSWYAGGGENASYHDGQFAFTARKDEPIRLQPKRFVDDWDKPGNIAVGKETRIQGLNDFCLDSEDNILACDAGRKAVVQIAPEDRLKAVWPLGFAPEAVECRADGTAVVAGDGRIAILDRAGKKLKEAALPGNAKTATGVSGSGEDVFVAVRGSTSYVIYRLDAELGGPKPVVRNLQGCCGQMDFTSRDGALYVAANCEFKVQKYDREGKKLAEFGRRGGAADPEGFDGCCEPKNVCFDSQGNLYTAESGSCAVKKFTPEGKLLEHVAVVKTIRGCVRVSVAVSRDGGRVYMLDTGRNIVRLVRPGK